MQSVPRDKDNNTGETGRPADIGFVSPDVAALCTPAHAQCATRSADFRSRVLRVIFFCFRVDYVASKKLFFRDRVAAKYHKS